MSSELLTYLIRHDVGELARDFLDLVITYYVFYRVALVLKGTRAMQVGVGLASVFLLYIVAQLLHLQTVLTLLQAVLSSAILIGVVVFQNDIRRGLMRMGSRANFGTGQTLEAKVIDDVVEAATLLARHRIGAIITFEQEANLDEFVGSHTGHVVDAAVSSELLVSLFIPEGMNKLHDGALIIRDLRIAKAGVFFPMPEGKVMDESFGSRHRAALGITEETDAVVVIVSEERGSISFCFNGNIVSNLDGDRLRSALEGVFAPKKTAKKRRIRSILAPFGLASPLPRRRAPEPERKTFVPLEAVLADAKAATAGAAASRTPLPGSANAAEELPSPDRGEAETAEPTVDDRLVQTERTSVVPPAEMPAAPSPEPAPKPLRKLVSTDESSDGSGRKPVVEAELAAPTKPHAEPMRTPLRHLAARTTEGEPAQSEHAAQPLKPTRQRESTPPCEPATPDGESPPTPAPPREISPPSAEDAAPGSRRLMPRTEAERKDASDGDAP